MSADGGPAVGSEFAGHRIESVLGTGGMGVVYRARHLALDRERALKVLSPAVSGDERFRERFRRESRMAASIEHPNVIPVHEAGELDGQLYLSMRLVEGDDLRALLFRSGPLDAQRATEIVAAVAAGLDAAHAAGLVHRDVKPANILVGSGGDTGRVYLTDFGISRTARAGETLTTTGEIIGTADFLSPEQIAGDPVDHRADIYALGAVLHFALTGAPPFARDNELATLFAHANAPRPRPSAVRPGLPPGLDAVVARAMAIDPADRFDSAGEFAIALGRAAEGVETAPLVASGRARQRRVPALAAAVIAGVVALGIILIVATGDDDAPSTGAATLQAPEVTVSDPIGVGSEPAGIALGDERAWVATRGSGEIWSVDLESSDAFAAEGQVPGATAVAVGYGSVWAIGADQLVRLDPIEATEPSTISLPGDPSDIAIEESLGIFVTLQAKDELVRIDDEGAVVGRLDIGDEPRAVALGEGAAWVVSAGDDTLTKVDPLEMEAIGRPVAVEGQATDVAVGEGSVWATDNLNGTLYRVRPGDPEVSASLNGELSGLASPRGVKAGLGYVWIANAGEDSIVRVDPEELGFAGEPISVGDDPADLAIGTSSVWTANQESDSVTRIDAR